MAAKGSWGMGQLIQESVGSNLPGSLALGLGGLLEGYTSFFKKCTKKVHILQKNCGPMISITSCFNNQEEWSGGKRQKNEN